MTVITVGVDAVLPLPPFVEVNDAVLEIDGHSPASVVPDTVTLKELFAAMVIGPQDRVTPFAIVQLGLSGLSAQTTPEGRVSEITTPVASPCPSFVTVTV